ncbi:MAG: Rieske (2Fe-2S) protein [Planctomycetaceae bacterium]
MGQFVTVARTSEIPEGSGVECTAAGRVFAVYHVGTEFFALDGICLHAGGPLGQGQLQGCIVTCPWHGWQYDVTTGQHCLNSRLQQPRYPVRVVGDEIQVELPDDA